MRTPTLIKVKIFFGAISNFDSTIKRSIKKATISCFLNGDKKILDDMCHNFNHVLERKVSENLRHLGKVFPNSSIFVVTASPTFYLKGWFEGKGIEVIGSEIQNGSLTIPKNEVKRIVMEQMLVKFAEPKSKVIGIGNCHDDLQMLTRANLAFLVGPKKKCLQHYRFSSVRTVRVFEDIYSI